MDHGTTQEIKTRYEDLLKHSTLAVIVPRSKDITAETLVTKHSDEAYRAPSRAHIFFDEFTTVHIILRSQVGEIKNLLPHLELAVSAHATSAATEGDKAPVTARNEVANHKVAGDSHLKHVKVGTFYHTAWTQKLHIGRPRIRLQRPTVYFTATLALSPTYLERSKKVDKEYLPSFQPSPANVLESLQLSNDDTRLYLSEARVTKVLPPSLQADDTSRVLRGASKQAFTASPALVLNVPVSSLPNRKLLTLRIETTPMLAGSIELKHIDVKVTNSSAVQISKTIPTTLRGGDEVSLLYELSPDDRRSDTAVSGIAIVKIEATIKLEETEVEVETDREWYVDLKEQKTAVYHAWSGAPKAPMRPVVDDGQVIFDLTTPQTAVVGEEFTLAVRCTNHSSKTRHFGMRADPGEETGMLPANALARTPNVRMEFIKAGETFETVVKYTALVAGVLDLGVISIIDLDSKESIEIQRLPDVIAHE